MYFAALLARTEDGWEARDMELDDVESLTDLVDLAREVMVDEDTVLAFIEQEDAWFGVVRVDGEDDPRIFVSDAAAASRSSYGSMLTDELLGGGPDEVEDLDALDLDGTEEGEPEDGEEAEGVEDLSGPVASGPLGDAQLLSDLGMDHKQLLSLGGDTLSEIADVLGCGEVLEAVR